jgi:hypothetical protein
MKLRFLCYTIALLGLCVLIFSIRLILKHDLLIPVLFTATLSFFSWAIGESLYDELRRYRGSISNGIQPKAGKVEPGRSSQGTWSYEGNSESVGKRPR